MSDVFDADKRSQVMRAVPSSGTSAERTVLVLLKELNVACRCNDTTLPGKPDIVVESLGKIVFVHGCFWHRHDCKRGNRTPRQRRAYWIAKLERNRLRDRRNQEALRREGWSVAVVWECQLKQRERLRRRLARFLNVPT